MAQIKAELILASKNQVTGDVLYTMRWTFPRIILAEILTHRALSRNTSSSRAIPMKKMRRQVIKDPFVPRYIGNAQRGMQAGEEITGWRRKAIELLWSSSRYPAVAAHWLMEKAGAPKQVANRLIEPWLFVTQVVSFTDIENFLKLRAHEMAEPHFQDLAAKVRLIVRGTELLFHHRGTRRPLYERTGRGDYAILAPGDWHLPFLTKEERSNSLTLDEAKHISAARCARTSYTLIEDGSAPSTIKDYRLGLTLVNAKPIHASPLEHQAEVMPTGDRWANFRGFKQFRYNITGESGGDKK